MTFLVFLIIALAAAARAWLLFGTPYVPGMNGGYYLVQARSILERGVMGIPDMPLTFHLHAGVASLIAQLTGRPSAEAIVLAVKLCDSLLPPLAAWPVFVLVRRWAASRGQGNGVPLAAAALTCLAAPWFIMVGDLEKNSLALLWLASLLATMHGWLADPRLRRGLPVLGFVALLGLTHIGVLGASIVISGSIILFFLLRGGHRHWLKVITWSLAATALLALAGGLVLWKFDAARIHRLITALTDPAQFSSDGLAPPRVMDAGPGPMTPFGPPFAWLRWLPAAGFAIAALPALLLGWRRRREIPPEDFAVACGCAVTVIAITGPWFNEDKLMRFNLIALLPAIVAGSFALTRIKSAPWRGVLASLAVLALVGNAIPRLIGGGRPILKEPALQELQTLAGAIGPHPGRVLIATQHGAEWWTAWFLKTRIAQVRALKPDDWKNYDAVYFLEVKQGAMQMPGPGGPGRAPGGHGFPPLPGMRPQRGEGQGPGSGGNPPPDRDPRGPRPEGDRPFRPNGGPPGMGPNPMMGARLPGNAEILHDGTYLRLGRVPEMPGISGHPDFQPRRPPGEGGEPGPPPSGERELP